MGQKYYSPHTRRHPDMEPRPRGKSIHTPSTSRAACRARPAWRRDIDCARTPRACLDAVAERLRIAHARAARGTRARFRTGHLRSSRRRSPRWSSGTEKCRCERESAVVRPIHHLLRRSRATLSVARPAAPRAGVAQLAERQPSKLNVAGSNPVSRSNVSSWTRSVAPSPWLRVAVAEALRAASADPRTTPYFFLRRLARKWRARTVIRRLSSPPNAIGWRGTTRVRGAIREGAARRGARFGVTATTG